MKSQLQALVNNAIAAIKSQSYPVAEFGGVPMVNTDLAVTAVNELKAMIDGMPEDGPFGRLIPTPDAFGNDTGRMAVLGTSASLGAKPPVEE